MPHRLLVGGVTHPGSGGWLRAVAAAAVLTILALPAMAGEPGAPCHHAHASGECALCDSPWRDYHSPATNCQCDSGRSGIGGFFEGLWQRLVPARTHACDECPEFTSMPVPQGMQPGLEPLPLPPRVPEAVPDSMVDPFRDDLPAPPAAPTSTIRSASDVIPPEAAPQASSDGWYRLHSADEPPENSAVQPARWEAPVHVAPPR